MGKSIDENRKESGQTDMREGYLQSTQAGNYSPQFMRGLEEQFGIPSDGIFNPYDYISQKNYKMNRRGQASYTEDLARLTYAADLRQQEFQNEYNSYENQVRLMREAGLNPDLLGVQTSGASSPGPSAGANPMSGIPTNLQQATNVVGIISNVASLVTSMLQGGLGISNAFRQQLSGDMSLMTQAMSMMYDYGMKGYNAFTALPNRVRKRIFGIEGRANDNISIGAQAESNRLVTSLFNSNFDRYSKQFNPYYAGKDFNIDGFINLDEWSKVWKPLADYASSAIAGEFEVKSKTIQNELDYQKTTGSEGTSLGSMRGEAVKESFSTNRFSQDLRAPLRKVVSNLRKSNTPWSNFALIALYLVTSLSFSHSSGPKGSSTSFGF